MAEKIIELWHQGYGKGKIALMLKFSESLIERLLKENGLHRTTEQLKELRAENPELFKGYFKKFKE